MLYGDDDTVWYLPSLLKLLADYDYEQPMAITDNLWYNGRHPNLHAPRCLPCSTDMSQMPSLHALMSTPNAITSYNKLRQQRPGPSAESFAVNSSMLYGTRYRPEPACPYCTVEKACSANGKLHAWVDADGGGAAAKGSSRGGSSSSGSSGTSDSGGSRRVHRRLHWKQKQPTSSVQQCKIPLAHGGAGIILSIGLLRKLQYDQMYECFMSLHGASGGDAMFSICLWRMGIAFTDPGVSMQNLYDPYYTLLGGELGGQALRSPMGEISRGRCSTHCMWALRNAVSLHLKGRSFHSWHNSAANLLAAVHGMRAAHEYYDLRTAHAAEGGALTVESAGGEKG